MSSNSKAQTELRHVLNQSDVRGLDNASLRAAYILLNYSGDVEFSLDDLAQICHCSRSVIPNALFKYLCGYRSLDFKISRYLAPIHESTLVEMIDAANANHKAMTPSEVIDKVKICI